VARASRDAEGDWHAVTEDGVPMVAWLPWRQDEPPGPMIQCPDSRASRIVASVLNGAEAHPNRGEKQ